MVRLNINNNLIENGVSDGFNEWIECEHPLTDKLQLIAGDACVEVLSQEWVNATAWDIETLDIDTQKIFCREIFMKSHNQICWFARTVIPQQCYALNPDFFNRLENESVRHLIFDQPNVKRTKKVSYPVSQLSTEYAWVKKYCPLMPALLWARLAEFSFQDKSAFYLIELLFPELEEL